MSLQSELKFAPGYLKRFEAALQFCVRKQQIHCVFKPRTKSNLSNLHFIAKEISLDTEPNIYNDRASRVVLLSMLQLSVHELRFIEIQFYQTNKQNVPDLLWMVIAHYLKLPVS